MIEPGDYSTGPMAYADEDEELLFGPNEDPNAEAMMGMAAKRGAVRRPRNLDRYFPALLEAARQPDAPAELQDFIRILEFHRSREG